MTALLDDLRAALGSLARRPGFALTVALILGLGTGLTGALFSLVDAFLIRPLPYPRAESLVTVWRADPKFPRDRLPLPPNDYFVLLDRSRSFKTLGAFVAGEDVGFDLQTGGEPQRVRGAAVTPEFFQALGVPAFRGRVFSPAEGEPGGDPVAILAHGLWRRRFGGDPAVLGRAVDLSGTRRTIIGVMPPGFDFPGVEVWVPRPLEASAAMGSPLQVTFSVRLVGRLADGVSPQAAQAEMNGIARELRAEGEGAGLRIVPLRDFLLGDLRAALLLLLGATGLVLLITCTNVANLILGRLIGRQPEISMRLALGATPGRLARQLLLESAALGVLGAGIGLLLCFAGLRGLRPFYGTWLPAAAEAGINGRVLAFLLAVGAAAGLLAGFAPALRRSRADLDGRLREATVTASSREGKRLWGALVIAQIALTFVLLASGGLMARSLRALAGRDLGFDARNALTFQIVLNQERSPTPSDRIGLVQRIVAGIGNLPGVDAAAAGNGLPLRGGGLSVLLGVEGGESLPVQEMPATDTFAVTPGYFQALGIPMVRGRAFTDRDRAGAPPVVVVDEKLARRLWPGGDPLGQRLQIQGLWREVVGVARPIQHGRLRDDSGSLAYLPFEQFGLMLPFVHVVARTEGDPALLAAAVRAAVGEIDAGQPVTHLASLEEVIRSSLSRERLIALLLGLFSLLGLILAATGVYALVAFATAQREKEIGIRIVLGAGRGDVLAAVLRRAALLTGLGLAAGLGAGLVSTRLLSHFLFEVAPADPATFLLVAALLAAAALAAGLLPGRRALRVDPARVLRAE